MILDDYEDEQIEQTIQFEKDKEQDEKIEELDSNIKKNAGEIESLKSVDSNVLEDLTELRKILHGDGADKLGLIKNTTQAMESAANALNEINGNGGLKARITGNTSKINAVESDYKEADKKIIEDLSEEVVTEKVVADTVIVNDELVVEKNASIKNLTVENLTQNEITASSITTNELKANVADVTRINTDTVTVKDDSNWITSNRDLDTGKLWLLSIPKYDGNVQIVTRDDDLAVTIINNTLVTFSQKSTYLYRVDFTKNGINLYFSKAFPFKTIWYGDSTHQDITVDTKDKTPYKNNINALTGVISATEFQYGDATFLNVIVVDELPEDKLKNVIYVVNGDKSYFSDGEEYIPMTTIDFVNNTVKDMFEGLDFVDNKVQFDTDPINLDFVSNYKVEIEE